MSTTPSFLGRDEDLPVLKTSAIRALVCAMKGEPPVTECVDSYRSWRDQCYLRGCNDKAFINLLRERLKDDRSCIIEVTPSLVGFRNSGFWLAREHRSGYVVKATIMDAEDPVEQIVWRRTTVSVSEKRLGFMRDEEGFERGKAEVRKMLPSSAAGFAERLRRAGLERTEIRVNEGHINEETGYFQEVR